MLDFLFLAIGFAILIKGADLLVQGASSIAKKFNVSELVIGLTIVAFGTSAPELFVSLLAGIKGNTDIAVGNVLGSNIANIFLILGISAVIYPLSVSRGTVWKEIPFGLLAAVVLGISANDRLIDSETISVLSRIDGLIFLSFFAIFMYYSAGIAFQTADSGETSRLRSHGTGKSVAFVLIGIAGLGAGGHLIIGSAVKIALKFGLGEAFVGLTIVAIGTSLPELATSVTAAYRKNLEIAVGNVVGSNIFNVFFILGISAVVRPLPFPEKSNFDVAAVILASILLFITMFTGKTRTLERWEGVVFIFLYVAYTVYLVSRI